MMDKIKLKNSIMWNCMNNEVNEFIKDELNTKRIFVYILGLTIKKGKEGGKNLSILINGHLGQLDE